VSRLKSKAGGGGGGGGPPDGTGAALPP